jgi:hypothetical protein
MSMHRSRPRKRAFRVVSAALALAAFSPSLLAESADTGFHLFAASTPAAVPAPLLYAEDRATPPAQAGDQTPPPPSTNPAGPTLQDLGFTSEQTRADLAAQARLDKRTHMLKIHQRLGLITIVPLVATLVTAGNATKHGTNADRNLHGALGIVTAGLYVTAASYAIRAPSLSGTETRGPIRLHKALAWIHGAGMILTPILGAMARSQLDHGEKVHGIASAHSTVAAITIGAYAAAIGAVAIKF